jgi:SAM-dependent methyltransferase
VVDQNQFAIERGRQKYPDVEFLDGFNGWISPFRDPVDAVVMLNSLGHVGNVEEVLREVQEALSETGVLIISCSNLRHYWLHDIQRGSTDPTLVHEFTPGSLRLALEEHDFTVVRQRCYGRRLFGVGPCARMLTVAMKTWRSDEERIGVSAAS